MFRVVPSIAPLGIIPFGIPARPWGVARPVIVTRKGAPSPTHPCSAPTDARQGGRCGPSVRTNPLFVPAARREVPATTAQDTPSTAPSTVTSSSGTQAVAVPQTTPVSSKTPVPTDTPATVRVNVAETATHYVITASLPGVAVGDVTLTAKGQVVTLEGERRAGPGLEEGEVRLTEIEPLRFARTLHFTKAIDADGATARLKDGLLRVSVPKVGGGAREVPVS